MSGNQVRRPAVRRLVLAATVVALVVGGAATAPAHHSILPVAAHR